MNRKLMCAVLMVVSSSALAQVLTQQQAEEKLARHRQEQSMAATQPATREEMDDLWTEVNKLKNEVQGLREELAQMHRAADFRGNDAVVNKPADARAATVKVAPAKRATTADPGAN